VPDAILTEDTMAQIDFMAHTRIFLVLGDAAAAQRLMETKATLQAQVANGFQEFLTKSL
jgi:hypothetical protein